MVAFASQDWLDEYKARINQSERYAEAAAGWEGAIAYVFDPEPDRNWPETTYVLMDLAHGKCHEARLTDREEAEQAPFLIRGPYTRWKQTVTGQLDPIKGMMQGKLRVRGDLATLVRYVDAAHELVNLAAGIPTEFPDER